MPYVFVVSFGPNLALKVPTAQGQAVSPPFPASTSVVPAIRKVDPVNVALDHATKIMCFSCQCCIRALAQPLH